VITPPSCEKLTAAQDTIEDGKMSEPAPGRLELLREFVNTFDPETGADDWETPDQLSRWMTDRGLLPEGARLSASDVTRTTSLREAVRQLGRVNDGADPDPEVLAALTREARDAPIGLLVAPDGQSAISPLGDGLDGALGTLLAILATAAADGTWERMKSCRNDACGWLFYDHSKNRSRHWCAANPCGNLVNARAYRARQRASSD
jgi:predicted RNA-binding Zn ribbon-like protein